MKVYDPRALSPETMDEYMDSYGVLHLQVHLISYNKRYDPKKIIPVDSFSVVGHILFL